MMRLIGFVGILVLAILTAFVLAHAIAERDPKGIALMLLFGGILIFFARILWLGRERSLNPRRPPKLPHPWPPKLLHLAGVN